ncbi:MAG: SCP2 sterol-binding domain-containing protein [Acidimicrobiales bacterium]
MADIYTPDWYDEVRAAINARVATLKGVPQGAWTCRVEIAGDGTSPYVDAGAERHFLVRIEGGQCSWYREVERGDESTELDYRFRGPATVFDEIVAGLVDPIDTALQGTVKVRGDMRFLMRQAELVKTLLEAYSTGMETAWPLGRPPYTPFQAEAVDA